MMENLTKEEREYALSVRKAIIAGAALQQEQEKYVAFGWSIAGALIGEIVELRRRVDVLEQKVNQ